MGKDNVSATPAAILQALSDVDREQARRRRGLAWFWLLTLAGAGLGAAIGWPVGSPWIGLGIGLGLGMVVGAFVSALVWVWPAVRLVWNWRVELGIAAVLLAVAAGVAAATGSWWWSLLLLVPLAVMAALPVTRRRLVAFLWCQVTRHRLQVCFAAFVRATNRVDPGLVPLVLSVRSTPAGERAWVWLRPGLGLADLQERADKIAVACWAKSVQVVASARLAALVRLDVRRRDPLTGVVASPLASDIPVQRSGAPVEGASTVGLGLDLADVPEPVAGEGARR